MSDHVTVTVSYGRYDFLSSKKEYNVSLKVPDHFADCPEPRSVNVKFPEDREPMLDDEWPSYVAVSLKNRLNEYLLHTGRDKAIRVLDWIIANEELVDSSWGNAKIESLKRSRDALSKRIASLEKTVSIMEEVLKEKSDVSGKGMG